MAQGRSLEVLCMRFSIIMVLRSPPQLSSMPPDARSDFSFSRRGQLIMSAVQPSTVSASSSILTNGTSSLFSQAPPSTDRLQRWILAAAKVGGVSAPVLLGGKQTSELILFAGASHRADQHDPARFWRTGLQCGWSEPNRKQQSGCLCQTNPAGRNRSQVSPKPSSLQVGF